MKYIFTKILNNHSRLRDDSILCDACSEIIIGEPVHLAAPPRDDGNFRVINTSAVVSKEVNGNVTTITTKSGSVYTIELKS